MTYAMHSSGTPTKNPNSSYGAGIRTDSILARDEPEVYSERIAKLDRGRSLSREPVYEWCVIRPQWRARPHFRDAHVLAHLLWYRLDHEPS
jgi:hypothetical protein